MMCPNLRKILPRRKKCASKHDRSVVDWERLSRHSHLLRVTHSEIERRRREKMNRYIDEIAQLLPIDAVKKLDKLTVLRVAVDTIKQLNGKKDQRVGRWAYWLFTGSSSKTSSTGFGKQIYLNDNELLELTLATIDQIGNHFFLIIECETGRICYASTSTEATLGYKPVCERCCFPLPFVIVLLHV